MQWQHGTYEIAADGSISLEPISVDGRQLMSDPCLYDSSILTRFSEPEKFKVRTRAGCEWIWQLTSVKRFEVLIDPYHEILRLNLYKADGAPLHPMYLALKPPRMLPTTTLQASTSATAGAESSKSKTKSKRDVLLESYMSSMNADSLIAQSSLLDANMLWWFGVLMTGLGSVLYFCY